MGGREVRPEAAARRSLHRISSWGTSLQIYFLTFIQAGGTLRPWLFSISTLERTMSLEAAVAELTQALKENTAALKGGTTAPATAAATKGRKAAGETTAPAVVSPAQVAAAQTQAPAQAQPPAAVLTIKQVADPFMKLVEAKRDSGVALLAKYGVKQLRDLAPGHFEAFLAETNACLASLAPAAASDPLSLI